MAKRLGVILSLLGIVCYVFFFVYIAKAGNDRRGDDFVRNGLLFAINGSILLVGGLILSKLNKSA